MKERLRSWVTGLPLLALGAGSLPLQAAEVRVDWVTYEDGAKTAVVSGELDHPIIHIVAASGLADDMRFIDACGDVFDLDEDMLGERDFGPPLEPRGEVRDSMALFTGSYDGVMFGSDRRFYEIDVSERNRQRIGLADFHFRSDAIESGLPLGEVEAIWTRRNGGLFFARTKDGNLMLIKSFRKGNEHARLLEPKKGWADTIDLVAGIYNQPKGGADSHVFVTLHEDGRLVRHLYGENPRTNGYDVESRPVADTRFEDIRKLLFVGGSRQAYGAAYRNHVLAWTRDGDIRRIDLDSGETQLLGRAGSYAGERIIPSRDREGAWLITATGTYSPCPTTPPPTTAPAETDEGNAIIAAADEIKAIHQANHARFRERLENGYPEDIWDKNKAQLTAALMPWLDGLRQFEADVVEPVREKVAAFIATYGERAEANAKLEPYTGSGYYLGMELGELQEDIERYDQYRRDVAETIAREGRTFFQMAQFMTGSDAANNFAKAMPYAELALLFDENNELARQIAAEAEKKAEFARAAEEAAIAAAVWPEDKGDFDFDPDDMKHRILAHFQEHHADEDHAKGARYFAIRLRSGWVPGKVNILGQLLEWRIGAYIAKTIPGDPQHALVIPVQIGTQTSSKQSPFEYRYFSSASYRIPIERVPVDDSSVL